MKTSSYPSSWRCQMALGIENISPFCIHPDVETMHSLDEFGCCLVVSNAVDHEKSIIDIFCQNTPLSSDDFVTKYIYFGQYLFTTDKQDIIRKHSDIIAYNIKCSAWDLYTVFYVPCTYRRRHSASLTNLIRSGSNRPHMHLNTPSP